VTQENCRERRNKDLLKNERGLRLTFDERVFILERAPTGYGVESKSDCKNTDLNEVNSRQPTTHTSSI